MSRKKIAWLSPLPPQRTGIADYTLQLARRLRHRCELELFHPGELPSDEIRAEFNVFPLSMFPERRQYYDLAIYHLGNNVQFHGDIYRLAWEYPSVVVLHDYQIHPFIAAFRDGEDEDLYRQALIEGYGEAGRAAFAGLRLGEVPDMQRFPMSHAVVKRSRMTVVHHRWVRDQFPGCGKVRVIPHFAVVAHKPSAKEIEEFKYLHGINNSDLVVSCLGFVNGNKLPDLLFAVVSELVRDGFPVKLLFAGEIAPETVGLMDKIRRGPESDFVVFTGYQDEHQYWCAIYASDVVINLRNPSMGEASGTLMQALAAGLPTVVSDAAQYREFPDSVCWKVPHHGNERVLLSMYLKKLLGDPHLRAAVGRNAAAFAARALSIERISKMWLNEVSG